MIRQSHSVLLAGLAGVAMAPAHAGLLSYQGVTFNASWAGNVLTLEIDAAGRKDGWASATGLAALEVSGIGNFTSMNVSARPGGASGWASSGAELNAKGCSEASNGQAGSRLCFYGQQIALADDMLFSFTFDGNAVRPVDPYVKVQFVDSKGKKVGDLLSRALPASPGTGTQSGDGGSGTPATPGSGPGSGNVDAAMPEIPPLADQSHGEPGKPLAGSDAGAAESASAVPEPTSIALLLGGLGLMGLGARGKRPG